MPFGYIFYLIVFEGVRIAEKLALSARPGRIVFFREGLFLRLYNHSLMRRATVGQAFKVSVRPLRCLQGGSGYSSGMPEVSWFARYRVGALAFRAVATGKRPRGRMKERLMVTSPTGPHFVKRMPFLRLLCHLRLRCVYTGRCLCLSWMRR